MNALIYPKDKLVQDIETLRRYEYSLVDKIDSPLDILLKSKRKNKTLALCSGFFCPIHEGHIRYIQGAKKLSDYLVVVVNSNKQWQTKKKTTLLPPIGEKERAEIVSAINGVDLVIIWDSDSDWGNDGIFDLIDVDLYCNGGDRSTLEGCNKEEIEFCKNRNIPMVLGVGGYDKPNSSSKIIYTKECVIKLAKEYKEIISQK